MGRLIESLATKDYLNGRIGRTFHIFIVLKKVSGVNVNSTFHGISLWLTPSRVMFFIFFISLNLPSVPLGVVQHVMSKDEEYMGYKIPAGAGLINNVTMFRSTTGKAFACRLNHC